VGRARTVGSWRAGAHPHLDPSEPALL